jgi:hypothetical protein
MAHTRKALLVVLNVLLFALAACTAKKDEACKNVKCLNNGVCNEGKCSCKTNYKGVFCETFDSCAVITCKNGGVCSDNGCKCPTGYYGPYCETVGRNKFIGNWSVYEDGSLSSPRQYPVTIQAGASPAELYIQNFYNYFTVPVVASVIGVTGDSIIIANQQRQDKIVYGVGYIENAGSATEKIIMRYSVIDTMTLVVEHFGNSSAVITEPSVWTK